MIKFSTAAANGLLNGAGLKEMFDGGKLYLFNGPVPLTADLPLDMSVMHTQVLEVTRGGDGTTGLTFGAPVNGVLAKTPTETWLGPIAFDGANASETTLTPAFYRFCASGDDGRSAADSETTFRAQGTAGGPNSGAELQFDVADFEQGPTQPIGAFAWMVER